ncbi:MAG: 4'-phosphopantetheinyl transferase superfamily protein [Elusimicrobiota bacterium]
MINNKPLWKIEQIDNINLNIDFLCDFEKNEYFSFKNQKRRIEFFASRILAKEFISDFLGILPQEISIKNDSNRRPYVIARDKIFFISLSHRGGFVGVAFDKDFSPYIGIDIEIIENKRYDFLKEYMPEIDSSNSNSLLEIWSIKEAVLKLLGKGLSVDMRLIEVREEKIELKGILKDLAESFKISKISYELIKRGDLISCICWVEA